MCKYFMTTDVHFLTRLYNIYILFFRFALMAVVPDRRKDCTKRLEMLKTNKMITIDALTHLVEQHDGRTSKGQLNSE